MRRYPTRSIKGRLKEYPLLFDIIVMFLWVGMLIFVFRGAMVLALRTSSPMMGVTSESMTHPDNTWRDYYEQRNYDTSEFPLQEGLQPGDLIFLRGPDSEEDIDVGEVVVWEKNNKRIVHRVAKKDNDSEGIYFRTRGDANLPLDSKIRLNDIVGEVVFSLPYLGNFSLIL